MDTHVARHKKEVDEIVMPHANDMCALGELICRLNPYTKLPKNQTTGLTTFGMEVRPPLPGGVLPGAQPPSVDEIIRNIAVAVVRDYGEKWSFKGQTYSLRTAFRIPYKFKVTTDNGEEYWQEESLLIGYAGSDGP